MTHSAKKNRSVQRKKPRNKRAEPRRVRSSRRDDIQERKALSDYYERGGRRFKRSRTRIKTTKGHSPPLLRTKPKPASNRTPGAKKPLPKSFKSKPTKLADSPLVKRVRKPTKLPYRQKTIRVPSTIYFDKRTGRRISKEKAKRFKPKNVKSKRQSGKRVVYFSRVSGKQIKKRTRSRDWESQAMKELFPKVKKPAARTNIADAYRYLSELEKDGGDEWEVAGGLYRDLLTWARDHNPSVLPRNLR